MKGTRIAFMAIVVMGLVTVWALVAWASPARGATLTVTSYKITSNMPSYPLVPADGPSTLVSGAHPDAGSFTTFSFPDATEDLKTALTNFGPGLLGNPESVPKCPEAVLQAGGAACPPASVIGTSRLDANRAGTATHAASLNGTLYNAELLGSEPGRLAAVTPTGPGTFLVSSIPFYITPRANGDYGLTGILTDINRLPSPPYPLDLQVAALGFVIKGATNGNNYVRNPTSCGVNQSTGQAIGYVDPTAVNGPPFSFITTGCQSLPFAPTASMTIGDRGSTGFNKYPPFVFKLTPPAGQADIMGNKLTLPIELNTNNTAYSLCSQAQADADSCPAASKFGWVTAKSPFLSELVQGPVYLIQQTASSLPGLLLDLRGRVHVKVQTKTTLINGKRIQSLVVNAPQLPISELSVALNGGKKTGVFLNRQDLCFKGNSTTKFKSVNALIKQYGWNGKQTSDDKLKATVVGCGPAVSAKLKRAASSRPSLTVVATKHPDAPNMKSLTVSLSKNLKLSRSGLSSGGSATAAASGATLEYVDSHKFKVTGLPATGAATVTIKLRKGALRVSSGVRKALKKGRRGTFSVKVTPEPVSGKGTSTKAKFKAKR
jgi:hypothetical protein